VTSGLILPGAARMAWYDPAHTGSFCHIRTGQGVILLNRLDPHGVELTAGGAPYGITKDMCPYIGRFFLAAATLLGVDPNETWQGEQHHADFGSELPQ
jgi:hypothetical protein